MEEFRNGEEYSRKRANSFVNNSVMEREIFYGGDEREGNISKAIG
jgi:hypothetical protein